MTRGELAKDQFAFVCCKKQISFCFVKISEEFTYKPRDAAWVESRLSAELTPGEFLWGFWIEKRTVVARGPLALEARGVRWMV